MKRKLKLAAVLLSVVLIVVVIGAGCGLETTRQPVEIAHLPARLQGFTIAHLSDLHVKEKESIYREAIERIAKLKPDLVVLTGDFVETPDKIGLCIDIVRQIEAPYGVWAVLGNWDYWMGKPKELVTQLRRAGIHVLMNEHAKIDVDGTPLYLVGVDDPFTDHAELDKALKGVPIDNRGAFVLLLAHSPDIFESAKEKAIPLTLVGHTHGGQVRLPLIGPIYSLTPTMRKYSAGLFQENGSQMYVNRGLGWSQTRLRFFCRPELTLITLHGPKGSE